MNIAGTEVDGSTCRVIAEMSNAHGGSLDRAIRIVDAAADAGCDFLKTQAYGVDELLALRGKDGDAPAPEPWGSAGWTMRSLYTKAATPFEWLPAIKERCERRGIVWFSSFFGAESLDVLKSLGNPCWKIAALDSDQYGKMAELCRTHLAGEPKIISTAHGCYNLDPDGDCIWLWAPPGYPQTDLELTRIDSENCYGGFSYHGTDIEPCVGAAWRGASIIEAHFQLDDEPSELEANVSLTASQFREMIRRVRDVEAMLA